MILINGESRNHVEISDRGFQYGDGLFETIEIRDRQAVFLGRHLERLESGCRRLHIPFPGQALLRQEIDSLCQHWSSAPAVLKIMITRGSGGRGYRPPEPVHPTRVLSLHPYPDYPDSYIEQGIAARFCATRLGLNPVLAGIKHMNRLEQVVARAEWNDPNIQEGVMLDINDHVIEGTMTNLFYIKNKTLYTAALTQTGVAGIMRGLIMKLAADHDVSVIEHAFGKDELLSADGAFVCNSIIGIWPIRQIEATSFSIPPLTRNIQAWLQEFASLSMGIRDNA
ncbi:MAG: aminodeoxychorismate lyase [Methylobacter sp.]